MQPKPLGPITQRLIEPEATIPQCVYDMIKAIPAESVLPLTQDANPVAFVLRSNNGAIATHFDLWVSCNAFPYGPCKRWWVNRNFRRGEGS
jgi:hypothetical protein